MSRYIPLGKAAKYVKDRIASSDVTLDDYVTTDNIEQNKAGISKAVNLPPQGKSMPKYEVGHTLVANIRPYLRKIWYATKNGGCSADVLTFEAKPGFHPKYIYYCLFQDIFYDHMMRGSKGSKMPRGDKKQILDFPIPDISYDEQKRIAELLSSLDSKIELNNRINAELEAMAKTIYDYWFVQFDFPISAAYAAAVGKPELEGRPYKSSGGEMAWNEEIKRDVPKGWEVGKLSETANITTGKLDSNAEVKGGKYPFFTCASSPTAIDNFAYDDIVLLIAGNNAAGNFHLNRYTGKFNAYQRTYIVTEKEDASLEYLYQKLKTELKNFKTRGNGSQTKFLTIGMLNDIRVFIKNDGVIKEFEQKISPLYRRQSNIQKENQELASLRDWLLPMLMNGQVKVGYKEKGDVRMAAEPEADYSSKADLK